MKPGWKEGAIVDWFRIGMQPTTYKDKAGGEIHKEVEQIVVVAEFREDGLLFWPERKFNCTTGDGSSLLEMLEGLLDRPPTDAERRRFYPKSLVGMACGIRIDPKEDGPRVYYNIAKWRPAGPEPYRPSGQYFRRELTDRERAGLAKAKGEILGQGQQPAVRPPKPKVPYTPKAIGQLLQPSIPAPAAAQPAASTESPSQVKPAGGVQDTAGA
jgi:hypothetical protein